MHQASQPFAWNTATQNGYGLFLSATESISQERVTNGASAAVLTASAAAYVALATTYEFCVARLPATGSIATYIRGGVYTAWTLVSVVGGGGANPSAAESTYTTSSWMTVTMAAGDKLLSHDPVKPGTCPVRMLQGVIDPTVAGELPS